MDKAKSPSLKIGTELLVKALKDEGVEVLFGYPGGAVLHIFDEFYRDATNHMLVRHEQGAVHAADGYARVTGQPGVCIVTSGPGATNTVTGIATAMLDSVPMVVITGQVGESGIGKDGFQEVDVQGIMTPITKYVYQIRDAADIQRVVHEAFYIANSGRKGPVVIDIPKNIGVELAEEIPFSQVKCDLPAYPKPPQERHEEDLKPLVEALKKAKKPLILWGHGVTLGQAEKELTQFIEKHQIPATSTLLGKGAYPCQGKYNLGMAGMHGTYAANMALMECDFLLNFGSRFDDRVVGDPNNFAPHAKIAHFDLDASELGKVLKTDFAYEMGAKEALEDLLLADLEGYKSSNQWLDHVFHNKTNHPLHYEEYTTIRPERLIEYVGEKTQGEAYVVTDVGQHQMWAAQFYPFTFGNQLLTSGGAGTMGYGVPAAIGAQVGARDRQVVAFIGDGGFQMTCQELNVLKNQDLPIKYFLINNASLGMVRQWQTEFYEKRYSHSESENLPDFVMLSKALGVEAARVSNPADLEKAVDAAFAYPGPYVLEVQIDANDLVLPMVAAGESNDKMKGVYSHVPLNSSPSR